MKKIFSKKFVVTLTSVFAIGTGVILACAGDWEPDYGVSNFTPEAFVDSSYRPFFYAPDLYYYGIWHDTQHDTRFNEININDWTSFLANAVPRAELEFMLLNASPGAIDSGQAYLLNKIKTLPASLQTFQLFSKRTNKKVQAFIDYLSLAKKCEEFAVNNLEYEWDYESKKNKTVNVNTMKLDSDLLQTFNKTKDLFIKERYWFQLERSYFFNGFPQGTINFFENNEKLFQKNVLYYRTMAYAAGAYHQTKNYSKANYYYSKVYDGCAELKTVAHYSFHPQEENDWKTTLALCANNDEKATLWQMLGIFYSDEKRAIQEIYTLNPRSEKLNLLLTRAVNIQEQKLTTWDDNLKSNRLQFVKDSINNDVLSLVTRIAQAGNTGKPYLWQMAAGYLNMLNGNADKAIAWYSLAEKNLPNEKLAQWQLRLLKLINTIAGVTKVDSRLENKIVSDLEWLNGISNTEKQFRYTGAFDWIKHTIANRYMNQKEFIKAVCFNNYPDFYVNNSNVEAMKSFLNNPNKSPFEQLCAKLYIMTNNDLIEYQAVRLAFEDNLEDAIAKMKTGANECRASGQSF